jgi:hypothetical protein
MKTYRGENREPYISKEGERELCKSIIAFVDILGFKELVRDAKDNGKSQKVFAELHETLSALIDANEDYHKEIYEMPFIGGKKDKYKIRIFTDCILIGCPIRKIERSNNFIEGVKEFYDLLSILYLFQAQMVNHGYFIRGAISVDELYMDDVIIYGNGVTEAYEGETKHAKYPRIILTNSAKTMFMEIAKSFEEKSLENYLCKFFYKDSDGRLFLNYLESIKIGDSDSEFLWDLEEHKKMVESKIIEYRDKPHYLEKYIWTANYHNCFCEKVPDYYQYSIDLTQYQMQPINGK